MIECLRSRQSHVVRYLSDRYLPMIRLLIYKAGGTPEDAKDIFQDGLIIMIEKIDSNDFVLTCKFKTFLYSVCRNLWLSVLEKRRAAANYLNRKLDEEITIDFAEEYDNKVYQDLIVNIYESLDPVCQQILKLYWEEYSPKEIAEKLGYTYGYVRKKKSECQQEFINKLQNHPDYRLIKKTETI
ncbi:MAG: sigma-70 family RNA polymerase sigma factor [Bacteroidales bacterium]|nr:MAG: sigma-70 family RNA polymerase sigma factor [Bacteroidales bacterium]